MADQTMPDRNTGAASIATPVETEVGVTGSDPSAQPPTVEPVWELQVFFDGDCPLCKREINMLRKLDRRQRILFVDIARPGFKAENYGITYEQLMAELHARLPDGNWISGVEVFRRLYGAIGLRWLMPLTRLPGISWGLNWGYRTFAKNRLKWTGRCDADGSCKID